MSVNLIRDINNETKRERGHICRACNEGLSRFKDNTEVMQKAIAYVKKHERRIKREKAKQAEEPMITWALD